MKKRGLLYAVFGLIFYLIFLAVEMPASWFAWGLNRFTSGAIRLDPIAGSLWRGNGRLVVYYPQTVPHDFGNTEWNINPIWLFTGQVQIQCRTDSAEQKINTTLRFGSGQTQVLETEIVMPASAVSSFYPPASLISPQGHVKLRTEKLSFSRDGLEGNAEIQWQNASSRLSAVHPLGTYRLEINGAGETTTFRLNTVQGALEFTGQGQWRAKTGQIQFNGSAVPRERTTELDPLLKMLGEDQGNGARKLALNTHFSFSP